MDKYQIKQALMSLSLEERKALLADIEKETDKYTPILGKRREILNNKIGSCSHCGSKK